MPVYPNRERALRHIKRTQAAYLYGRFPQRYILGTHARHDAYYQGDHSVPSVPGAAEGGRVMRDLIQKITRG